MREKIAERIIHDLLETILTICFLELRENLFFCNVICPVCNPITPGRVGVKSGGEGGRECKYNYFNILYNTFSYALFFPIIYIKTSLETDGLYSAFKNWYILSL